MKLKILGSLSPYPKGQENGVGYLITNNTNVENEDRALIVLDLGFGVCREFNFPDDLKNMHVILSHLHGDHIADFAAVSYASFVFNKHGVLNDRVKIYIPKGCEGEEYDFMNKIANDGFLEFIYYDENTVLNIDGIEIRFQKTLHPVPTFAARLTDGEKVISYTADSGFDEILIPFYNDSDILISDCGYLKKQKGEGVNNHQSAYEDGIIAKKANVKKLLLSHFWPETEPWECIEEAKENFEATYAARTGQEYEL